MINAQETLDDKIVAFLADTTHATVLLMKKSVAGDYSIQAFYQSLKKLQGQGVIVKFKNNYSLKLSWVTGLVSFSQHLENQYVKSLRLSDLAPLSKHKHTWQFNSLVSLNNFWSQILLLLVRESESKILFDWSPYPWYYLAHIEQEQKYLAALKSLKGKVYMIIGGREYLYKQVEQYIDSNFIDCSFTVSPFGGKEELDFNVIDDYILTIKLNKELLIKIEDLYKNTTGADQLDVNKILDIFFGEFSAKMTLEYNPNKAKALIKKFSKYFGLK